MQFLRLNSAFKVAFCDSVFHVANASPYRRWYVGIMAALLFNLSVGLPVSAMARQTGPKAMQFALVKSVLSRCDTVCDEWISAEGTITRSSIGRFRKVLKEIGDKRVPVFIHSPGGDVDAAIAIGRLIRAHHLDISVSRTEFRGCLPGQRTCMARPEFAKNGFTGLPNALSSACASACAVLIAAGEHRFVSLYSRVGVHQVKTMIRTVLPPDEAEEGSQPADQPVRTRRKWSAPKEVSNPAMEQAAYVRIEQFYREMGIDPSIMALLQSAKPSEIHWMTQAELTATHLQTDKGPGQPARVPQSQPVKSDD